MAKCIKVNTYEGNHFPNEVYMKVIFSPKFEARKTIRRGLYLILK